MLDQNRQHSDQTGGALSTKMNIFGDKGIIRVRDAAKYHEVAFIPFVRRDVGNALELSVKIFASGADDREPPSFDPARGGALQLTLLPFKTHVEFTATPNEPLFSCPRYDIRFTEVDKQGNPVGKHFWMVNGFQNGDDTFENWSDGPLVYTALWHTPSFAGTADVEVTASDLGGNIGTTSFAGILSQAEVGDEGAVVGRDAPARLEVPAGAAEPGSRVLLMGRPDITGGRLEALALSSAPTDAKLVAVPAALGRSLVTAAPTGALAAAPQTGGEYSLHVVGYAYEVAGDRSLTGVSTLKLSYDGALVPNEDKLGFYRWDDELGRWRSIAAEFDRQADEAYAAIDSYGLYALGYSEMVEVPQEIDSSRYTFSLEQNFPNPYLAAAGETTINFSLPADSHVSLRVYDLSGRLITTLVDDTLAAGRHTLGWNGLTAGGTAVESGVYFYKLDTETDSATRRLVLVR